MALDPSCISRSDLRALAVATLLAANTLAGKRVYQDHAQPLDLTELPALLVATPAERKDTAGESAPQFTTVITLAVMARVAPGSETKTEAQLDQLIDQVQRAILCTPSMVAPIQRFEFVETQAIVAAEGEQMVGEAAIIFGCQVYQLYQPDAGDPFLEIVTTIPASGNGPPVVFDAHLPQ